MLDFIVMILEVEIEMRVKNYSAIELRNRNLGANMQHSGLVGPEEHCGRNRGSLIPSSGNQQEESLQNESAAAHAMCEQVRKNHPVVSHQAFDDRALQTTRPTTTPPTAVCRWSTGVGDDLRHGILRAQKLLKGLRQAAAETRTGGEPIP